MPNGTVIELAKRLAAGHPPYTEQQLIDHAKTLNSTKWNWEGLKQAQDEAIALVMSEMTEGELLEARKRFAAEQNNLEDKHWALLHRADTELAAIVPEGLIDPDSWVTPKRLDIWQRYAREVRDCAADGFWRRLMPQPIALTISEHSPCTQRFVPGLLDKVIQYEWTQYVEMRRNQLAAGENIASSYGTVQQYKDQIGWTDADDVKAKANKTTIKQRRAGAWNLD
ncbi:MAG TPA: hypothetical protein VHP11_09970 [Tepidisphaeraceae bacterium]|nr:hypothetical protein [Tepidisphaeraceae bacterium]